MKDRIDNLLVKKGFFPTRQKAKYALENEIIYIDGKLVTKPSKEFEEECNIEIKGESLRFVSRGGLKLDKAINKFEIKMKDKICMDIGASTGGFTDCMLQNGAKKVYAVDVGHDQLDEKLKLDDRVINLEKTNIKDLQVDMIEKVDFISIDVSFISLIAVIETAYKMLKEDAECVALIKPQFEAGKEYINKNGVVKDKKVHMKVIEKVLICANTLGFKIINIDYSPIKGPAGNIEYLVYMKKEKENKMDLFKTRELIKNVVEESHKRL